MIINLPVALTFDIEKDCSPFLNTTRGIEVGLPKILRLLEKYDIECTFFITGDVADLFPHHVRQIAERHEVSSHGYIHETFEKMTLPKKKRIRKSKQVLERVSNQVVIGFRAPRFRTSKELYETLIEVGFKYDSSVACFTPNFLFKTNFPEFRVQLPSALINFPKGVEIYSTMCRLITFPVLFFHCWEAVDTRSLLTSADVNSAYSRGLRPDLWVNTGKVFLEKLEALIRRLLDSGLHFTTLHDVFVSSS